MVDSLVVVNINAFWSGSRFVVSSFLRFLFVPCLGHVRVPVFVFLCCIPGRKYTVYASSRNHDSWVKARFFSGDNRTGIKEESESLQRLMWASDLVWRKNLLLFLLQAALPFHRLLIYFMVLLHLFLTHLCSMSLFISSLLWTFNSPTLSPCQPVPLCAPLCRLDVWHLWLCLTLSRSQRGRSGAGCAPFISSKCNYNTSLRTAADPLQRLPSHWRWRLELDDTTHTQRTN